MLNNAMSVVILAAGKGTRMYPCRESDGSACH